MTTTFDPTAFLSRLTALTPDELEGLTHADEAGLAFWAAVVLESFDRYDPPLAKAVFAVVRVVDLVLDHAHPEATKEVVPALVGAVLGLALHPRIEHSASPDGARVMYDALTETWREVVGPLHADAVL